MTLLLALILSSAPDAGTLTAPPLVPMEPMVFGSLDKDVIRKIIGENRDQIRGCYESALKSKPDLRGKVR